MRAALSAIPLLWLCGCGDHGLVVEPIPELCNGGDDDGDGLIDEAFLDLDGNGRADCLDATCWELATVQAGAASYEPCLVPTVPDPWALEPRWTYDAPHDDMVVYYSTAAVGFLVDDDGDGVYGSSGDAPTVVFSAVRGIGNLPEDKLMIALDGRSGEERWVMSERSATHSLVIADLDADGVPELLGADADGHLTAYAADGSVLRSNTVKAFPYDGPGAPLVTDLEPDTRVDVLFGATILDGATLEPRFTMDVGGSTNGEVPAVADIDDDGDKEIALAGRVFDSNGALLWDSYNVGIVGTTTLFVQADDDRAAELAIVGERYELYDTDGTLLAMAALDDYQAGPACTGDFDGDGVAEVAWANLYDTAMYELDGSARWRAPALNGNEHIPVFMPACSAADLNGDGATELLISTWYMLQILDGPTGRVLYEGPRSAHVDGPVVADLDRDGSLDLLGFDIEGESEGAPLVYALSHADRAWPAGPEVRPSFDFDGGNIGDDGAVPTRPPLAWLANGGPRTIPAAPTAEMADLRVTLLEACTGEPGFGPVEVTARVENIGLLDAQAGAQVALYADEGEGVTREVARAALPAVPALTVLDTVRFRLRPEDVGAVGWHAVADVSGMVFECDETDNTDDLEHR